MKRSVLYILTVFVLALALWSGVLFLDCTAPVNVNVKAEAWQCQTEIKNGDGTVTFHGCQKTDGAQPVDQEATDGPDNIQGRVPSPERARLN